MMPKPSRRAFLDEANAKGWVVVDMKNDWKAVFAE
jgi:hypothetical protein